MDSVSGHVSASPAPGVQGASSGTPAATTKGRGDSSFRSALLRLLVGAAQTSSTSSSATGERRAAKKADSTEAQREGTFEESGRSQTRELGGKGASLNRTGSLRHAMGRGGTAVRGTDEPATPPLGDDQEIVLAQVDEGAARPHGGEEQPDPVVPAVVGGEPPTSDEEAGAASEDAGDGADKHAAQTDQTAQVMGELHPALSPEEVVPPEVPEAAHAAAGDATGEEDGRTTDGTEQDAQPLTPQRDEPVQVAAQARQALQAARQYALQNTGTEPLAGVGRTVEERPEGASAESIAAPTRIVNSPAVVEHVQAQREESSAEEPARVGVPVVPRAIPTMETSEGATESPRGESPPVAEASDAAEPTVNGAVARPVAGDTGLPAEPSQAGGEASEAGEQHVVRSEATNGAAPDPENSSREGAAERQADGALARSERMQEAAEEKAALSTSVASGSAVRKPVSQGTGPLRSVASETGSRAPAASEVQGAVETRGEVAATSGAIPREAARQVARAVPQDIVREARLLQRNGESELRLQLNPPELGRMRVEVQMRDGTLSVRMRVENAEVREALRDEVAELGRALRQADLSVAQLEVSDFESGRRGDGGGQYDGAGASNLARNAGTALDESEGTDGYERTFISDSGRIDCLV